MIRHVLIERLNMQTWFDTEYWSQEDIWKASVSFEASRAVTIDSARLVNHIWNQISFHDSSFFIIFIKPILACTPLVVLEIFELEKVSLSLSWKKFKWIHQSVRSLHTKIHHGKHKIGCSRLKDVRRRNITLLLLLIKIQVQVLIILSCFKFNVNFNRLLKRWSQDQHIICFIRQEIGQSDFYWFI